MLDAEMNHKSGFAAVGRDEKISFSLPAKRSFQKPAALSDQDIEPPLFYQEHSVLKPEMLAACQAYKEAAEGRKHIERERVGPIAPGSEGAFALIHALKAENSALVRYNQLLERSHGIRADEPLPNVPTCHLLTKREREVLNLVAEGKTTKEIAFALGIAFKTAVCHRYRIMEKLGVHSSAALMRVAIKLGFVNPWGSS